MSGVVKICGLKDPGNIREVIQLKPDWIGLIFYSRSPRYIADPKLLEFLNNLPDRPLTVAVFVDPVRNQITDVSNVLKIDMIQLHGSETPGFCQELRECGHTVMKAFGIHNNFDFRQTDPFHGKTDFFLFDNRSPKAGGSGEQFDWDLLQEYQGETPFLLSGGITADTRTIPYHRRLAGVDLNSRFEKTPGIKNIDLLNTFLTHFRNE